ncbi:hypothetical protein SARC_06239 [Sphaeroforma arctica JP610]|uniref:RFX1-4/6/8-like BCD domain-containing protein n=1 Tax=Sphaeroforma arctica JP610 TaxID=667725 RepID=A0A0L0FZM6_9EUKA|nr:hypothetical protein SARC_06239 [Sphaeroforma arctica JP610]KNC81423.1 hypothetical protein SARC_06239 [Sphaeroforma arctica JP610]|eukprot:XP_014155325.1 hypothetical protein SARC_06239 [Sphaeroforma arctica JP610]
MTAAHAKHIYETKGLDLTSAIQFGLKDLLNDLPFLEDYLSWLTKLINKTLVPRTGPLSIDEANLVLVQWSFLFSAIIRDLTLRSASSFGHFHLVRLLMDEYVAYSIDTYKRTQQSIEIANKVWGMQ